MPGPMIAAAGIGAGGSLATGAMGASAAKKAAAAQEAAAKEANQLQRDTTVQARIDSYPWALEGAQAMYQYMDEIGIPRPQNMILPDLNAGPFSANGQAQQETTTTTTSSGGPGGFGNQLASKGSQRGGVSGMVPTQIGQPQTVTTVTKPAQQQQQYQSPSQMAFTAKRGFQETPGYQYNVNEAERGVVNQLSSLGMRNSGAALKALTRTRMGLANQEYGNWLNRIAGVAGMGQSQVNQTNTLAANSAINMGQNLQNAGDARASGYVGAANAWGRGIAGASNNISEALGYWDKQKK